MTDQLRKAAEMALLTLEGWNNHGEWVWPESALFQSKRNTVESIEALRQALAQPEQEPVAVMQALADNDCAIAYADGWNACVQAHKHTVPPPKHEWVGLTDAELAEFSAMKLGAYDLCLEVEAKLKEKNRG